MLELTTVLKEEENSTYEKINEYEKFGKIAEDFVDIREKIILISSKKIEFNVDADVNDPKKIDESEFPNPKKRKIFVHPQEFPKYTLKMKEKNIMFDKKSNGFPWIKAKDNSCVYDSFLTIFSLGIYNKNKNLWKANKCKKFQKKELKALVENIVYNIEFADNLIAKYRNYSKKFESFKNLLESLSSLSYFTTKLIYMNKCSKCDNKRKNIQTLNVFYASVDNLENYKGKLIDAYINYFRINITSTCPIKSIGEKSCEGDEICELIYYEEPQFLLMCLDSFFENDGYADFKIKKSINQNKLVIIFPDYFVNDLTQTIYNRVGVIFYLLGKNHFIAKVSNPRKNKFAENELGWYLHDGLSGDQCLKTIGPKEEWIKKNLDSNEFPYLIFYEKI